MHIVPSVSVCSQTTTKKHMDSASGYVTGSFLSQAFACVGLFSKQIERYMKWGSQAGGLASVF